MVQAISQHQVTSLKLLGLSAAFETIYYSILERLSFWFNISYTALSWIKSYLKTVLSMSIFKTLNRPNLCFHSFMEFDPQGSVLGLSLSYISCQYSHI